MAHIQQMEFMQDQEITDPKAQGPAYFRLPTCMYFPLRRDRFPLD